MKCLSSSGGSFMYFPHTNLFKYSINGNYWEIKLCAPIAQQQPGQESFQFSSNHWSIISVLPWTKQSPGQKCLVLCLILTISVNTEPLHDLISHLFQCTHYAFSPPQSFYFAKTVILSKFPVLLCSSLPSSPATHSCVCMCWDLPLQHSNILVSQSLGTFREFMAMPGLWGLKKKKKDLWWAVKARQLRIVSWVNLNCSYLATSCRSELVVTGSSHKEV